MISSDLLKLGNRNAGARLGQSEALPMQTLNQEQREEDHSDTDGKIAQQGDQASQILKGSHYPEYQLEGLMLKPHILAN